MRVVELDRERFVQGVEAAAFGEVLRQHVLQAGADEEVVLLEAQLLALRRGVVRVQDARDVLRLGLRRRGLDVPAGIEHLDVERRDGAACPEAQVVDRRAAVARDQLVESDGPDVVRLDPAVPRAALRVLRADAAAAEGDDVTGIVARDLPRAALAHPRARDLALPSVLVDDLREDAVVVADPVADRRILQRRERIEKAGGEAAKTAVAESRIVFFLRHALEVVPELGQRFTCFLHQVAVEAGEAVDERAAEQVLDRQVTDALDARLRNAALGGQPARGKLFAHRERKRVVDVALRGGVGVLAERARQAVEQDGAQRAGLQRDSTEQGGASHVVTPYACAELTASCYWTTKAPQRVRASAASARPRCASPARPWRASVP